MSSRPSPAAVFRRLVPTCLLVGALLALLVDAPRASAAKARAVAASSTAPAFFGINAGTLFYGPQDRWPVLLDSLRQSGVQSVRFDVAWAAAEPKAPAAPGQHVWNWHEADNRFAAVARAGLSPYPILDYSALWAGVTPGDQMSRPSDPAAFAAFAQAAVARYKAGGAFWSEHPDLTMKPPVAWEVWNEQNSGHFWKEQQSAPEDYALLFSHAQAAIKSADQSARVVVGGLVDMNSEQFITRMMRAKPELARRIDGVGYHGYLYTSRELIGRIKKVRRTLDRAGLRRAGIELTEVGWSTVEMSEAKRGRELARLTREVGDPALGVTRMIPFALLGSELDPAKWDHWFGLWTAAGTPKASASRWTAEVRRLAPAVSTPQGSGDANLTVNADLVSKATGNVKKLLTGRGRPR
jgi:hypothetical protein